MQKIIRNILINLLKEYTSKIESGTCEISEEEASEIMAIIAHKTLTKEQACDFMHLKRSRFDDLVRAGKIPRGRKHKKDKELVWYEDELRIIRDADY